MKKHGCEGMAYHANFECEIHENPFECLDKIIIFDEKNNDYCEEMSLNYSGRKYLYQELKQKEINTTKGERNGVS